jgi:hypothetical protein
VRFAAKKRRDGDQSALQFAALQGNVDVPGALISSDDDRLGAENVLYKLRDVISDRGRAGGATFGRLAALAQVVDSFVRTITANDK